MKNIKNIFLSYLLCLGLICTCINLPMAYAYGDSGQKYRSIASIEHDNMEIEPDNIGNESTIEPEQNLEEDESTQLVTINGDEEENVENADKAIGIIDDPVEGDKLETDIVYSRFGEIHRESMQQSYEGRAVYDLEVENDNVCDCGFDPSKHSPSQNGHCYYINDDNQYVHLGTSLAVYSVDNNSFKNYYEEEESIEKAGIIEQLLSGGVIGEGENYTTISGVWKGEVHILSGEQINESNDYDDVDYVEGDIRFSAESMNPSATEDAYAEVVHTGVDSNGHSTGWILTILPNFFELSSEEQLLVLAHEFGHVFGLGDVGFGDCFMCTDTERNTDEPTEYEMMALRNATGQISAHSCNENRIQRLFPFLVVNDEDGDGKTDEGEVVITNEVAMNAGHILLCDQCCGNSGDSFEPHTYMIRVSTSSEAVWYDMDDNEYYRFPTNEEVEQMERISINISKHGIKCNDCGYIYPFYQEEHSIIFTPLGHYRHEESCTVCEFSKEGRHVYNNISIQGSIGEGDVQNTPMYETDELIDQNKENSETLFTDNIVSPNYTSNPISECSLCGYMLAEEEQHIYEIEWNDESHWSKCDCGYTVNMHPHNLEWCYTGTIEHWQECACGYESLKTGHKYVFQENDDDTQHRRYCSECNFELLAFENHIYNSYQKVDAYTHIKICGVCEKRVTEQHNLGRWHNNRFREDVINGINPPEMETMDLGEMEILSDDDPSDDHTHSRGCLLCTYEETEEHSYEWTSNGDTTHTGICSADGCADEATRDHRYVYTNLGNTHKKECEDCEYSVTVDHNLSYTSTGNTQHSVSCADCEYSETTSHTMSGWASISDTQHRNACTACEYATTGDHVSNGNYTENGSTGHTSSCTVCSKVLSDAHSYPDTWTNANSTSHSMTCTANGCGYVKTANHSYGDWSSKNGTQHQRSCTASGCGRVETADHSLSYTNKSSTQHTAACATCGYSADLAHSMAGWTSISSTQHKNSCSACTYSTTGNHSASSYTSLGSSGHRGSCSTCSASFDKGHSYPSSWSSKNGTKHQKVCTATGCGYAITADHSLSYTNKSSTKHTAACATCGYSADLAHSMSGWTSISTTQHKNSCSACTYSTTGNHSASSYTSLGSSGHRGSCSTCNVSFDKGHSYPSSWSSKNGTQHQKVCTAAGCGYAITADHSFGAWSEHDAAQHKRTCSTCNKTFYAAHSFSAWARKDSTNHSRSCATCGRSETGAHSFGSWTSYNETQHRKKCSTCSGYNYANHGFGAWSSSSTTQHKHTCSSCNKTVYASHDKWSYQNYSATQHKKRCTTCTSPWYYEAHTEKYTGGIYMCSKCGVTLG